MCGRGMQKKEEKKTERHAYLQHLDGFSTTYLAHDQPLVEERHEFLHTLHQVHFAAAQVHKREDTGGAAEAFQELGGWPAIMPQAVASVLEARTYIYI